MKLSDAGRKITNGTGVASIMEDIRLATQVRGERGIVNLGAGNPVTIDAMSALWINAYQDLLSSKMRLLDCMGRYQQTRGLPALLDAICQHFSDRYSIHLGHNNIMIAPGSQSIYFYAANLFTGRQGDAERRLLLPSLPDYTGYGGVSLADTPVMGALPRIRICPGKEFRYEASLDAFDEQELDEVGVAFLSRPCNPSGRIVSRQELLNIVDMISSPLFVDNAYGDPFPSICFTDAAPVFSPRIINTFSFSATGLSGERTAFAMGDEEIISGLCHMQSNTCIHGAMLGQMLATLAMTGTDLHAACVSHVRSHYLAMYALARQLFEIFFVDIEYYLHVPEGGVFVWLWIPSLMLSDVEVYEMARQRGVFIVPGSLFFPGAPDDYEHARQCFRISLTCDEHELEEGIRMLAQVLRSCVDTVGSPHPEHR